MKYVYINKSFSFRLGWVKFVTVIPCSKIYIRKFVLTSKYWLSCIIILFEGTLYYFKTVVYLDPNIVLAHCEHLTLSHLLQYRESKIFVANFEVELFVYTVYSFWGSLSSKKCCLLNVYVSVRSAEDKTNGSISTKFTTNISAEPK